ncbi:ROK family protein [Chitinophagaceae bacterium LB-8]|uniref:ROK family protein n=1 Tax=Paraflavisolibacter caeni TaxID=2982496 RepID=A0A9X2Y232_9BACT|nr:ROK family protein [Paraflavisolibacter caeni]MCU7552123.1 ROK family protein [Paraflavisolibacter caeni]
MNQQTFAIGVDIGGTTTKSGVVNHRGEIILEGGILPTAKYTTAESFVEALSQALMPAMEKVGVDNIRGIGVGAPNGNYYRGTVEHAPNLPWRGVVPLAQMITERFELPCSLTNDANAAAVGEGMYGAARGMKDFIVLTLGTGVGSGIVAGGGLVYGYDGFAGELGHTIVRRGRKHWSTGLDGSLEAYTSATGIALTARVLLDTWVGPSQLRGYRGEEITSKLVCECALQGDELAQKVFQFTGEVLGEALANFVMFSSPEAIILFGGVIKAGDLLMQPTRKHMEKNLLPIFQGKVKLLFSELKEADAAILGASALVWERKEEKLKIEALPVLK